MTAATVTRPCRHCGRPKDDNYRCRPCERAGTRSLDPGVKRETVPRVVDDAERMERLRKAEAVKPAPESVRIDDEPDVLRLIDEIGAMTLTETGRHLRVCRERVRQVETAALSKLRPRSDATVGMPCRAEAHRGALYRRLEALYDKSQATGCSAAEYLEMDLLVDALDVIESGFLPDAIRDSEDRESVWEALGAEASGGDL